MSKSCKEEYRPRGLVRRGLYAYQLAWWLRHFPAKQLLVLNHGEVRIYRRGDEGIPMHAVAAPSLLPYSIPPCPAPPP